MYVNDDNVCVVKVCIGMGIPIPMNGKGCPVSRPNMNENDERWAEMGPRQ